MREIPQPRPIRPVPDPLGLYFHLGHNDHKVLAATIAAGRTGFSGVIVDARRVARHRESLDAANRLRVECILDPGVQALAMPGGFTEKAAEVPWGGKHLHRHRDWEGPRSDEKVEAISKFTVEHHFSEVIAPTHYLSSADDPWLDIDIENARRIRAQLNRNTGRKIGLIYLLTITYAMLRDAAAISRIVDKLLNLSFDGLWIRVDPFGSDSTGTAMRNFLEAAPEFHRLGVPIVADRVGGLVGLGLLSAQVVGGISHGVTTLERFNANHWKRISSGDPFSLPHRVYLPSLDFFLMPKQARQIFEGSPNLRGRFVCSDPQCCPRGLVDMVTNPGMHFLTQRMNQIRALGTAPASLRAAEYLSRLVRPTADAASRFAASNALTGEMKDQFERHQKRLTLLRVALEDAFESSPRRSFSSIPDTRVSREHRLAR